MRIHSLYTPIAKFIKYACVFLLITHISLCASDRQNLEIIASQDSVEASLNKKSRDLLNTSFEENLKTFIHIANPQTATIGMISIDDMKNGISDSTWIYVNAALNEYKKTKPVCIVLRVNTPGGEVYAAQRISDALKEIDTQFGIPVIAYIDNWAISAGAMLAYSCRFITVAKDASMGAAEPVFIGAEGKMEEASEKINSALRADFENRARFFGRNPLIAKAMVDKDVILVKRGDEIIELSSDSQIVNSDTVISPKGKLLTLDAEKLMEYNVANFQFEPQKTEELTEQEQKLGKYSVSKTIWMQIPFFAHHPHMQFSVFTMNLKEQFISFLALPQVSSALLFVLLICIYTEISTGGFGMAAACGIISLFFLVLPSFALQAITWLDPILFLFGLMLTLLEVFFFPTLGILGLVGVALMLISIISILVPGISSIAFDGNTLNGAGQYVLNRLAWLSGAVLIAGGVIVYLSRTALPKIKIVQKIVLHDTVHLKEQASKERVHPFVGKEAYVISALRPAGKIRIDQDDYDALSSGNFIAEGVTVRVIQVDGSKILVEEIFS